LQRNTLTRDARTQYNSAALSRAEFPFFGLRLLSKPIRTVLRWQLLATAALALFAGALAGAHGAVSAALGGAVSVVAGGASAMVATAGRADSAGGVLVIALKAEAVKLGLIAILLGLVLAVYSEVVVPAFLGSFMATVLIFSMAFFVREHNQHRS
jgi:ATP synthase protein I